MKSCLICSNDIESSLVTLLVQPDICQQCFEKLEVIWQTIYIDDVEVLLVYSYNEFMKELIYRFKGRYDRVLKNIFLQKFILELKIRYYGYQIVPIPSNLEDDQKRGYNHVIEIFSQLGKINPLLRKKVSWKQSEKSYQQRLSIKEVIELNKTKNLPGKILLVDDILTSGATIKTAIKLLKLQGICKIKVLIVAYAGNKQKLDERKCLK